MDTLLTIVLIGIDLSMDCFAVAIAAGAKFRADHIRTALLLALFFGAFQAGMTIAGFLAGSGFSPLISTYDHWVAAAMLFAIGGKMVYEGIRNGESESFPDQLNYRVITWLAVATSLDALAVGISFALLDVPALLSAFIICIIAAVFSAAGVLMGGKAVRMIGRRADIACGIILVLIGLRILSEHMAAA